MAPYLKHAALGFLIPLLIFAVLLFILVSLFIIPTPQSIIKTEQTGSLFVNSIYSGRIYFAMTPEQQAQGLMNITDLSKGFVGMLFIFNTTKNPCFWMKNTMLPLHQYWLVNNTIVHTWNGTPYSINIICSRGDAVLEAPDLILRDGQKISVKATNFS